MSHTQSDLDLTSLESARSTYNGFLMMKNSNDLDEGVLEILRLLHDVPFDSKRARQKINKGTVKKVPVSATLALISGTPRDEAWKIHNKIGLPVLKDLLTSTYGNNLPQQCEACSLIYVCHDAEICKCVSCNYGFCPVCCPNDASGSNYFYPICSPCLRSISHKNKTVPVPASEDAPTAPPAPTVTATPAPTPAGEPSLGSSGVLGGGKAPSQPPGDPGVTPTGRPSDKPIDKVCGFYARSCCKFGSKGEGCSYSHPNKCYKWLKRGLSGCSKGTDCEYYHAKLCKSAAKGVECTNEKCTLPHVAKLTNTLPGPRVQWPGPGRVELTKVLPTKVLPSSNSGSNNTFAKAKANMAIPTQDFHPRRIPEAPDMALRGLLEAVALLTKQMGEIMLRLQAPVSSLQSPVLYPHPPPPIQAHNQPTYQAFPYHQHLHQVPVVRMPNLSQ
jgi:hypothetical protein